MSDYDHRWHAGNHGDVWKHVALLAALAAAKRDALRLLDTHAGRGEYTLGGTGEWTAGVGRLLQTFPEGASSGAGAVDRYLARIRRAGAPATYPGSPLLALGALGRRDRLVAVEAEPATAAALQARLSGDPRAVIRTGDGLPACAEPLPGQGAELVFVDPPYVARDEWERVAEAVIAAAALPDRQVLLWYPVKRWSRPNALHARLREAGVPWVALDLLVSPLELERRALAGSGVLLVRAPRSVLAELCAAAPILGPALATHDGRWSLRVTAHRDG